MSLCDEIIQSLKDHPDQWRLGRNWLDNTKSMISIWVSSGQAFLRIEIPFQYEFGYFEKRMLWKAINRFKEARLSQSLKNGATE